MAFIKKNKQFIFGLLVGGILFSIGTVYAVNRLNSSEVLVDTTNLSGLIETGDEANLQNALDGLYTMAGSTNNFNYVSSGQVGNGVHSNSVSISNISVVNGKEYYLIICAAQKQGGYLSNITVSGATVNQTIVASNSNGYVPLLGFRVFKITTTSISLTIKTDFFIDTEAGMIYALFES